MSSIAPPVVRSDGLSRTTLRIGGRLGPAAGEAFVRDLQRVPGVLTVEVNADATRAFVAHDAGVPIAALRAAVDRAGFAATVETRASAAAATAETGTASRAVPGPYVAAVGLAAMLAVVFVDFALPNSPDKRWLFIMPVFALWAFVIVRATRARRS